MFERFDEDARRCIFWSRLAAAIHHSDHIAPMHLLEGIKKESPATLRRLALPKSGIKLATLSEKTLLKPRETQEASREIPLNPEAKRALNLAVEASEKFGSEKVAPAHLLWGIFRADEPLRKRLQKAGLAAAGMEALLKRQPGIHCRKARSVRSGIGYDLHRLAEKRKLILGGVEVPFEKGPAGHSDGDVLSHAICDALLGAAGLGDIGTHFPDSDPKWRGVSSLVFLRQAREHLERCNWRISHIDAIVVAQEPKLGPHFPAMRDTLAKALQIHPARINLKAKTNEGVDAIGRGEAIAAHAIATLEG